MDEISGGAKTARAGSNRFLQLVCAPVSPHGPLRTEDRRVRERSAPTSLQYGIGRGDMQ